MKPIIPMRAALADEQLFAPLLGGDSWAAWRVLLIAVMGEALNREERRLFESLTKRAREPLQTNSPASRRNVENTILHSNANARRIFEWRR